MNCATTVIWILSLFLIRQYVSSRQGDAHLPNAVSKFNIHWLTMTGSATCRLGTKFCPSSFHDTRKSYFKQAHYLLSHQLIINAFRSIWWVGLACSQIWSKATFRVLFMNWTVLPIVAWSFYLLIAISIPWREEILSICEVFMSYKTYNDTK